MTHIDELQGLEELEDNVHRLLEDDRSFHDKDKFTQLQQAIGTFLQQCQHPDHLDQIKHKLQQLINYHPATEENTDILNNKGTNILQMGIPYSINSGVVTVMQNLTETLQDNHGNVAIINHWWHEYSYWDEETQQRINVQISPYCLLTPDGQLLKLKWNFKEIAHELKNTYNYTPDACHVHTHTFYHDKSMQLFHDYYPRTPIIYTLHQFIPYLRLSPDDKERLLDETMPEEERKKARDQYQGRETAQEQMLYFADEIITINPVHQEAVQKIYPEVEDQTHCIPNGTDFDRYHHLETVVHEAQQLRQEYAPHGERIVIYVGRVEEQKGAIPLAKGFNKIASYYDDAQLILIGATDDELQNLLDFGLKQTYTDRVHTTGWIDDDHALAAHYRLADMMVQPVFTEELYSMASLEAMVMETPVVSCPGDLTIGNCDSPKEILNAAQEIFNNEQAMKHHTQKTKENILKDYSMEAMYNKHMDLYQNATRTKH